LSELGIKNIFFKDVEKLFDSTIQSISEKLNIDPELIWGKLEDKHSEIIDGFDKIIINAYSENHKFSLEDFMSTHQKNQDTIVSTNSEPFKQFIIFINCCHIIYQKSYDSIETKEVSTNLKLCISIYGLIVRKSEQIVSLLIDGYIDAAMIIWRSLYENGIAIITLLNENSDELAKKFINHSVKNSKNKIESYKKNHEELKFPTVPEKIEKELENEEKRVEDLYGKKFIKNEFGWANDLIEGNQRATLRSLEQRLNLNRYRPYYLMCSEHIHVGFNALNGYFEDDKVILPRILKQETELKSFIDPMQFTVAFLYNISDYFLNEVSAKNEYNINIKFLKKISNDFINTIPEKSEIDKNNGSR
jgi:hypothetical protein